MSDKAVVKGCYSDFKIIKTRKVCQVVVELPLEQAQAFIHAFGLPQPGSEQWVALARLQTPAKEETPPTASPVDLKAHSEPGHDPHGSSRTHAIHRRFEDLPLPQQAALACQDMEFREFVRQYYENDLKDERDAALFVREWCDVESRAQIYPGTPAGEKWGRLYNRFLLWKSAKAA
jgi:hypothetical protein